MMAWLTGFSAWLATLPAGDAIRSAEWVVPAVQTVHILAIAIVFTGSLVVALRAAHVSGIDWSPARWGARLNRWTAGALIVLFLSGAILILGEPDRSLLSPVFQLKMVLVVLAAALSWALARRLRRRDGDFAVGTGDRLLAGAIVLLWVAVIAAGRWIAYYYV